MISSFPFLFIGQSKQAAMPKGLGACLPERFDTITHLNHAQLLERIRLRKPRAIFLIRGLFPEPKAENELTNFLKETGIPLIWCMSTAELSLNPNPPRFRSHVKRVRVLVPRIRDWTAECDAALAGLSNALGAFSTFDGAETLVPITTDNTALLPGFIERVGADPKNDKPAAARRLVLRGVWTDLRVSPDEAPSFSKFRETISPLFESCRSHCLPLSLQCAPLCQPRPHMLSLCNELDDSPEPFHPNRSAACEGCSLCVLRALCPAPDAAAVSHCNPSGLSPFKSFNSVPRRIRPLIGRAMRRIHVDSIAEIPVGGPCNNRCSDCQDNVRDQPSLPSDDAAQRIANAASRSCRAVRFTGGEPTIRKDFLRLAKAAEWLGLGVQIHTNGRTASIDDFIKKLGAVENASLRIRLSGPDAETHNNASRADSFDQTLAGVRNAVRSGIPVDVSVRLRPDLADKLADFRRLVAQIPGIRSLIFKITPEWVGHDDAFPLSDLALRIEQLIESSDSSAAPVYVEGIPLCLFRDFHSVYRPGASRLHMKPAVCSHCSFNQWCCGLPEPYTIIFGAGELRPDLLSPTSEIPFALLKTVPNFDISRCPVRSKEMPSPDPSTHLFIQSADGAALYARADSYSSPTRILAAKNFRDGFTTPKQPEPALALSQHCAECPELHACAACYETAAPTDIPVETLVPGDGKRLIVTADGTFSGDADPDATILSFRDFWALWSQGAASISGGSSILLHDVADRIPSIKKTFQALSAMLPPGAEVLITGRNLRARIGANSAGDRSAVSPFGFPDHALSYNLKLTDYREQIFLGGESFWALQFKKSASPLTRPRREKLASLFIIKTCVAQCVMCNIQQFFKQQRAPVGKTLDRLDRLALTGFEYVDLFGGEVTLRDDLPFLIAYADAAGLKPMIITTGHSLDGAYIERLRDSGVRRCTVSLDAPEAPLHDSIKGARGLFQSATASLLALGRAPGVDANVNTVLLPENFHLPPQIIRLVAPTGVPLIRFFLCLSSPVASPVPRTLSKEQLRRFFDDILPEMKRLLSAFNMKMDFRPELPAADSVDDWIERVASGRYNPIDPHGQEICAAPVTRLLIDPDGIAYPCEVPLLFATEHALGDTTRESLIQLLDSKNMKTFRNNAGRFDACRMCFGAMPVKPF